VTTIKPRISQVIGIDNSRHLLPFLTSLMMILLAIVTIWFLGGGSFRLYASAFFGLYALTKQIWLSVVLIGVLQNLIFLPLRFFSLKLSTSLKEFEDTLEEVKNEKEQYILFTKKVKEGNPAIIFFIINFFLNTIAFFSAGRIFLIDFYNQKLDPNLLYSFIPYPEYPLQGTDFHFPFFSITQTAALSWSSIFLIWFYIVLALVVPRLLWRLVRFLFWKNKQILSARISYNKLLLQVAGFSGTLFVISLVVLRHIPTAFEGIWLVADLTIPNRTLNTVTAIGTFITAFHAGYIRNSLAVKKAQAAQIPQDVIQKVTRENLRQTLKNSIFLGLGAFLITNQIPCAFELSIATFELLYILSPYTFDLILNFANDKTKDK
jgi:hypothetical protein